MEYEVVRDLRGEVSVMKWMIMKGLSLKILALLVGAMILAASCRISISVRPARMTVRRTL